MNRYKSYCNLLNQFLSVFEQFQSSQKIFKIESVFLPPNEDLVLRIDDYRLQSDRCDSCNNLYNNITFQGLIFSDDQDVIPFEGVVSGYLAMCQCDEEDVDAWFKQHNNIRLEVKCKGENGQTWRFLVSSNTKVSKQ